MIDTPRRQEYNELVSGGCLVSGVAPNHEAIITQDRLEGRTLGFCGPQSSAGCNPQTPSVLFISNLHKAARIRGANSDQGLTHIRAGGAYGL
jgi:hypothetical protein